MVLLLLLLFWAMVCIHESKELQRVKVSQKRQPLGKRDLVKSLHGNHYSFFFCTRAKELG
jgi:hypothetical protein